MIDCGYEKLECETTELTISAFSPLPRPPARFVGTENILGYGISKGSINDCISEIVSWVESSEKGRFFVCANPHSLEVAREDSFFRRTLKAADLIVPDGIGMVIASKILGGTIRERVTGSDIFWGLSSVLNKVGNCSYFFLGSTGENLRRIREKMKSDFPNIRIAGTYAPPFKQEFSDDENKLMIKAINRAKPDVLWIGMTAPKQEKWIYQNRHRLDVKLIGPVGAVFAFYSGSVKRADPILQKIGLEWFSRLFREPRRLWRRNLISNPSFLMRVVSSRLKGKKTGLANKLFLKLLEPIPLKRPIHLGKEDLTEVRKLAEKRGLLMLLHKRLTENKSLTEPEEEVERFLEDLRAPRYSTIARCIRQENAEREISAVLGREGIPTIVLRGNAIARELYDAPYCRASSDIDLLIRKSDAVLADSILTGNGYRRRDALPLMFWLNRIHHAVYVHPETDHLIELHWHFSIPAYFRLTSEDIWAEVISDETGRQSFSPEMTVIQLLMHHQMHAFRELKILVDILWALHACDDRIDWKSFAARLKKIGLVKTTLITLSQIRSLWGDLSEEMPHTGILRHSIREMGYNTSRYLSFFFDMEVGRDYLFQSLKDKFMSRFALDRIGTICFSFLKSLSPAPHNIRELYEDERKWMLPFNYWRFIIWRLTERKG
jgi:N-acetylglucosaminyldiphosphoundecaprenol N-acetyl-beta-D-mannosaminyltransferase